MTEEGECELERIPSCGFLSARLAAMVGIGADEHALALVVEDDLVEIGVARATERAGLVPFLHAKGMVLEIEALHLRIRRQRIDALLAAGPEKLQGGAIVELRI